MKEKKIIDFLRDPQNRGVLSDEFEGSLRVVMDDGDCVPLCLYFL